MTTHSPGRDTMSDLTPARRAEIDELREWQQYAITAKYDSVGVPTRLLNFALAALDEKDAEIAQRDLAADAAERSIRLMEARADSAEATVEGLSADYGKLLAESNAFEATVATQAKEIELLKNERDEWKSRWTWHDSALNSTKAKSAQLEARWEALKRHDGAGWIIRQVMSEMEATSPAVPS